MDDVVEAMRELHDWVITNGGAGRLCVLPEKMAAGREIIKRIKCAGIVGAVEQLKKIRKGTGRFPKWVMGGKSI